MRTMKKPAAEAVLKQQIKLEAGEDDTKQNPAIVLDDDSKPPALGCNVVYKKSVVSGAKLLNAKQKLALEYISNDFHALINDMGGPGKSTVIYEIMTQEGAPRLE